MTSAQRYGWRAGMFGQMTRSMSKRAGCIGVEEAQYSSWHRQHHTTPPPSLYTTYGLGELIFAGTPIRNVLGVVIVEHLSSSGVRTFKKCPFSPLFGPWNTCSIGSISHDTLTRYSDNGVILYLYCMSPSRHLAAVTWLGDVHLYETYLGAIISSTRPVPVPIKPDRPSHSPTAICTL
jgi:hypothetical protein